VGWCTQASVLKAAGCFPITSGVPAPDPTTVSLPRARHRIRAGISEQTRPAAAKELDCLQIINNRLLAVSLPRPDEFLRLGSLAALLLNRTILLSVIGAARTSFSQAGSVLQVAQAEH